MCLLFPEHCTNSKRAINFDIPTEWDPERVRQYEKLAVNPPTAHVILSRHS